MARMVTFTEARRTLAEILDRVRTRREHVVITRNGTPEVVLLSWEEYESLLETLEVLDDPDAMAALARGEADEREGRVVPLEEVHRELGR